jgi:threonylcarbamoyladenosine tRNA methylthiotransferase MtaB
MRRPYDQNLYLKRLRDVRASVPDTIIGADVIVGFPGETEEDFEKTRRVVESGLIDYLHVFSYSDRPGTTASEYRNKVNPEVIKERNTILSRISHNLRAEAYRRQIGRTLEVIAEHKKPPGGSFWGIADNYVKVLLPHSYEGGRRIVKYLVTGAAEDHVTGELLE